MVKWINRQSCLNWYEENDLFNLELHYQNVTMPSAAFGHIWTLAEQIL